jgi:hypothetical protein
MTHFTRLPATLLVLAVAAGQPLRSAQQSSPGAQVPPFRGGTDLVRLDVSVLDKDGMPIQGLTAADFSILEDGAPQLRESK